MVTRVISGSQAATINTEHSLATDVNGGVYSLDVDASAMQNGETLILRVYVKFASGDAKKLKYEVSYVHAQGEPIIVSVPVVEDTYIECTLQQTTGTGRTFPWRLLKL